MYKTQEPHHTYSTDYDLHVSRDSGQESSQQQVHSCYSSSYTTGSGECERAENTGNLPLACSPRRHTWAASPAVQCREVQMPCGHSNPEMGEMDSGCHLYNSPAKSASHRGQQNNRYRLKSVEASLAEKEVVLDQVVRFFIKRSINIFIQIV